MTQKQRVLEYIIEFGSITHMEAFIDLGIVDLPKRISELINDDGIPIHKEAESGKNRYGDVVYYKRYSLEDGYEETEGFANLLRILKANREAVG